MLGTPWGHAESQTPRICLNHQVWVLYSLFPGDSDALKLISAHGVTVYEKLTCDCSSRVQKKGKKIEMCQVETRVTGRALIHREVNNSQPYTRACTPPCESQGIPNSLRKYRGGKCNLRFAIISEPITTNRHKSDQQ